MKTPQIYIGRSQGDAYFDWSKFYRSDPSESLSRMMRCVIAVAAVLQLCVNFSTAKVVADSLHYLFESLEDENENIKLPVKGAIPRWVSGAKYNSGFAGFDGPSKDHPFKYNYLFDVMPMAYKFGVKNGEVTFSNKFINSKYRKQSFKGIPPYRTFDGTTPDMDLIRKAETLASSTSDNMNVNLVNFNTATEDHLFALSDMEGYMEVNMTTLETIGNYQFNDQIQGKLNVMTSAHPSSIANDPYLYSFNIAMFSNPLGEAKHKYKLFRVNRESKDSKPTREVMMEIPIVHVPYVHSFAVTPNFIVFVEFPLFWNIGKIMKSTTIINSMEWDPSRQGTRIIVIDKNEWKVVKTVQAKTPMWAYHHINAFEDGKGNVVMDIAAYADSTHLDAFSLVEPEHRTNQFPIIPSTIQRLTVATAVGDDTVEQTTFSESNLDMARINQNYAGQPYKWVYAQAGSEKGSWWNTLVKVDMATGAVAHTWQRDDHWPSEPLFVPRPGATEEDDGVVVATIMGGDYGYSYMLVLDAKTFEPLAEADVPFRIPYLAHGNWYDH